MKGKYILLLSLCTVLLGGCAKETNEEEKTTLRSVEVSTIGKDSISSNFTYSGKAVASKEISVAPTIPGEVTGFHFEVGDTVRENQVLFTVDSSELTDQLRSAEANYNVSVLNLENAEKTYNNNKVLFDEGIIAEKEMDQIKLAYETSKANIEALEVNLDVLKKKINDCSVTAPMSGVIATRNVERGSFASQSVPAYVIMDLSTIKVEVGVSEQAVNSIQVGDEVGVKMSAISSTPFVGKVSTISPASNQTGTYAVKVELDNQEGQIKSGMLAEVSFTKETADDVLVLPRNAVLTKDGVSYIYILDGDTAKKTVVNIGIETGETIQITSDLPEGTQVVTRGQTYLSDGEKVTVENQSASAEKSSAENTAKGE